MKSERLSVAHGIRGAIRVYSYAESSDCFAPGTDIVLQVAGDDPRRFKILKASPYKSIVRLTLEGVTSRNQAETLTSCAVCMFKANLPVLEEDVFYWTDLLGMDVFTVDNVHLGRITDIIPTGANDVYVVKPLEGQTAKEILIPAIASVVPEY